MGWPTWREATQDALYGPGGFFRREQPADHFRTSVHASGLFAGAVDGLARVSGAEAIVDLGAGRGELLVELHRRNSGVALSGVEIAERPSGLPDPIAWSAELPPDLENVLVVANEWLDDVPVDVVEVDEGGAARIVHVDPASGAERLGAPPTAHDAAWLDTWWPVDGAEPGTRAEIGRTRDDAWSDVVRRVRHGVLVAVDYSHGRAARPPFGTLAGYHGGRPVAPIPDGSCDVTAHVALDACAAAGVAAGASATLLTTQRAALRALGVDGSLPAREQAKREPAAYLAALSLSAQAAELIDPGGLGEFGWLVQTVGVDLPAPLRPLVR